METASLVLGIIGGIAGIFGALFAIFVGGVGGAFGVKDASTILGLGLAAMFLSIIGIVAGALAKAKPKPAGIMMLIAGIGGIIAISVGYVVAGPLLILAGIFALVSVGKEKKLGVQEVKQTTGIKKKKSKWLSILGVLAGVIGLSMGIWDAFKASKENWFGNNESEVLEVKGFYIGMDIEEAAEILAELLKMEKVPKIGSGLMTEYAIGDSAGLLYHIGANKERKVQSIWFSGFITNELFNTGGLSAKEFITRFIEAYEIREKWDYFYSGNWPCQSFTSPHGYKVTICEDRSLNIESVAKKEDLRFD
jgi:MFS family permease